MIHADFRDPSHADEVNLEICVSGDSSASVIEHAWRLSKLAKHHNCEMGAVWRVSAEARAEEGAHILIGK